MHRVAPRKGAACTDAGSDERVWGLSHVNSAELDETKTITLDEIEAIVRDVLADDAIALRLDSRPREIEGWDSLANVSIVFGVEESLGVRLGTDVLIGIETVGDLVSAVEDARSQTTQVVGLS